MIKYSQTGGLLSDVFLHLIPHSFMGENQGTEVRVVMVDDLCGFWRVFRDGKNIPSVRR
jgi:hypothetical protein